ncbi:MAG: type IV-A pilus assembly ATPase PilB [Elusimicrobia bacterium]|nr:type IV-A pilus assembly ATPase PilB [Elusimicrobiota bacterium]
MARRYTASLKRRLGELLIEAGILEKEQLQQALEIQRRSGGKLGRILVDLGYLSEEGLMAFLGKQFGVGYISLAQFGEIPEEVLHIVPEGVVRRQTLIPIAREGKTLTIAMADPLNVLATDDLKLLTGCDVEVVIASPTEIREAIDKYYGPKESMEELVEVVERTSENHPGTAGRTVEVGEETIELGGEGAGSGEDAPVVRIANLLLLNAIQNNASDIHLEPFEKAIRIRYRLDGVLHEQPAPPKKLHNALVSRFKIMAQLDIAERRLPQDGRIKIRVSQREVDFRVSVVPTVYGEKVVLRLLDTSGLRVDLTQLGMEPEALAIFQKHIELPFGIILDTGPTGSGKSTTLYSTLATLNFPDRNIITIEDPVEYHLEGVTQVHARPDIGLTFASGLRAFLRQDPDIIMVGEIRDTETAEIAINAALTGHLVFSTLHTNDAPGAVTRLSNMGIEPFLTASTVIMIVAQRLVRVICTHCKEPYEIPASAFANIGAIPDGYLQNGTGEGGGQTLTLYRGKRCDQCAETGYRGRLGIFEVMAMSDELREFVLQRASSHTIKQAARRAGMLTLREAAIRKVLSGVTTIEELLRVTAPDEPL